MLFNSKDWVTVAPLISNNVEKESNIIYNTFYLVTQVDTNTVLSSYSWNVKKDRTMFVSTCY